MPPKFCIMIIISLSMQLYSLSGLAQDCSNSIAYALELLQSFAKQPNLILSITKGELIPNGHVTQQ